LEEAKRKSDDALKEVERLRIEIRELKDDIKAREKYNQSVEKLREIARPSQSRTIPDTKSKRSPTPSQSSLEGNYVASKNSNKYHFPSCQWAQRINPSNRVVFKSAREAIQAGYVPCKVCKPPTTD